MKLIGHRGAAGVALENSPESIKAVLALPIDAMELDVRRTKDGQLIVLHDKHTGRVADRELWPVVSTLRELRKLKLSNGERILTLDEALTLVGDKMPVVLDLKSGHIGEELASVLKQHPVVRASLSSRNYPQLKRLRRLLPETPIIARSYIYSTDIVHIARRMGAGSIAVNKWVMNPLTYHLAKRAGLETQVYTVNHPWLVRLFTMLYPDIAIYTDYPERFVESKTHARQV